jgi:transcriptional regulator with XRE-family HTH domain
MSLGKRLNKLIKEKGISKYKLAKDLGVPPSTVRSWINYNISPREPNLEKLANYFKVHPAWLRYTDEALAPKFQDRSLRIDSEIRQFTKEYPECLPYLEEVIELFINEYKKASAGTLSQAYNKESNGTKLQ